MPVGYFEIVENGLISDWAKFRFKSIDGQNTIRNIDGNKIGLVVVLSADGKPNLITYHEIENIDLEKSWIMFDGFPSDDIRDGWLQRLADQYANS